MLPHPPSHPTAEACEDAFYEALERGDLDALLACWSDDDDVVCVHPGGTRLVGWSAVREAWEAVIANGGLSIHVTDRRTHAAGGLAVHHVVEHVTFGTPEGEHVVRRVLAINVLQQTPQGWLMVAHHAAPTIEDDEPELIAAPASATLH